MLDWFGEDISEKGDKSLTKIVLQAGTSQPKAPKKSSKIDLGNGEVDLDDSSSEEEEDDDEGFQGQNKDTPKDNILVKINFQKNQEPKKENFEYVLGEEELHKDTLPAALKTCLQSMKSGEKSEFTYRNSATGASDVYTVELLSFDNGKESWDMT